jgi:hypothetical protein
MAMKTMQYQDAREKMKAGDVIAFGGKGHFSELIKFSTRSGVSHVGIILRTKVLEDKSGRFFNQIIESTGHDGVGVYRFSDRLTYSGEIWWLPLRQNLWDQKFDSAKFYDFLFNEVQGRPYDLGQAVKSALDVLDELPLTDISGPTRNREDFEKFFCSELVAAGLEKAGMVGEINASEVTPIDLCRWDIYEQDYYLIQGDQKKQISRFNTLDPAAWMN